MSLEHKRDQPQLIPSSREYAWVLGVLTSQGFVELHKKFGVESNQEKFLEAFKFRGEHLFRIAGSYRRRSNADGAHNGARVIFYSRSLTRELGDLRISHWPNTIREKHSWVLQSQQYSWGFLEGVFERKGRVDRSGRRSQILFYTYDLVAANLLADLLVRVGIEGIYPLTDKNKKESLDGIAIYNMSDIARFAQNVHSVVTDKEAKLEICRGLVPYGNTKKRRTMVNIRAESDEKNKDSGSLDLNPRTRLIDEYKFIRGICLNEYGRLPTVRDLIELRRERDSTGIAFAILKNFGGGNITQARITLERIILEEGQTEKR